MVRFTRTALGVIAFCLLASSAWAEDMNSEQAATLVPSVCPASPGAASAAAGAQVQSRPVTIAAPAPGVAVPASSDTVTTPSPSSRGLLLKTKTPGVSQRPAPDVMKAPITLDQALQIAFQNSPQIQSALSLVEETRGGVDEAAAQFRPTFSLGTSFTVQGPTSASVRDHVLLSWLSVALPLDVSHQLRYASNMSEYQFQAQYLSMVSTSEQLIVDVKDAYYTLLRACGQEAVAQAAVDDAKAQLDNVTAKFEEGSSPKYDVTSAQVNLENLNQSLIAARNATSLAQASLNGTLGVDVSHPTQVVRSDVDVTTESVDIPKSIDDAYAGRPDLKAAQMAVTLYEENVKLQKAGLAPSVSLSSGPSYNFNPSSLASHSYSWDVAATLNLPLFDGGRVKSKVRQAEAQVKGSVASLDQARIGVATEVRAAALNLQDSALRTKTTERAVALAVDALSIARDRYDAGMATLLEVTNAQSDLTQARFNYIDARYDYATALAQLQKATSSQPELAQLQLLADQSPAGQKER